MVDISTSYSGLYGIDCIPFYSMYAGLYMCCFLFFGGEHHFKHISQQQHKAFLVKTEISGLYISAAV